ncbi:hypothetical protein I6F07_33470, partial [Ensifer sp. IC4062]|nr:hypothetical protein [Ensifer sp. IC4062]
MAPHRNPPLPPQLQQPKTAGANSKLDKTLGARSAIVRERYADFGPTLAAEKLAEHDGLTVSRETLRKWMAEAGLW